MKKLTLLLMIISSLISAKDAEYLGTFTIDNYPIKGCEIVKIGHMYSFASVNQFAQSKDIHKKDGLLANLDDTDLRGSLEKKAIDNGFNAILGYKFYTSGAFDTFGGGTKNGDIAFGVFTITSQGTPVLIKCK